MKEDLCPDFDTCFISSMLKAIEVPHVLQYCMKHYGNCRYHSRPAREAVAGQRAKEADA
ncbi:MAG: hypothetical protein V1789_11660 [PVC group bacterium]